MSSPVVLLLLSLVVAAAMIGRADGACETAFTHEGYIIDTLCWQQPGHVAADGAVMDTNPEDHTRKVSAVAVSSCLPFLLFMPL